MLTPASEASPDQLNDPVTGVRIGLLYHEVTGRNAWYSTWINRYRPDSMHISFEAAQTRCESRRVQGTVFNIFQLPSLVFKTESGHLILSELNTKTHFSRLKLAKLQEIDDVLPVGTLSLNQIRRLFRVESPLWEKGYPPQDSAVFTFDALKQELEPLPEQHTRPKAHLREFSWPGWCTCGGTFAAPGSCGRRNNDENLQALVYGRACEREPDAGSINRAFVTAVSARFSGKFSGKSGQIRLLGALPRSRICVCDVVGDAGIEPATPRV